MNNATTNKARRTNDRNCLDTHKTLKIARECLNLARANYVSRPTAFNKGEVEIWERNLAAALAE